MGLRINTNVQSMTAQANLRKTGERMAMTLERLSTGSKINRGADDVVGLGVSETLRSQIRGIDVAVNNISKGVNILNTADGSLGTGTEGLQKLRELAVQAADDTISSSERTRIINEFSSTLTEFDRQMSAAEFNGVKLLDGTFASKNFQVGPNANNTIAVNISDARSSAIGATASYTTSTGFYYGTDDNAALTDISSLTVAGVTFDVSTRLTSDGVSSTEADESAIAYANLFNYYSGQTKVTARANANTATLSYGSTTSIDSATQVSINGVNLTMQAYSASDTGATTLVNAINAVSAQSGVTASIDTANDKIICTAADGRNIDVKLDFNSAQAISTTSTASYMGVLIAIATASSLTDDVFQNVFRGTVTLESDSAFTYSAGSTTLTGATSGSVSIATGTTLNDATLTTAANATSAISLIDSSLRQLQTIRADVGSKINRFKAADTELGVRKESYSAADSRIRDTDIADETANLTKFQILQQAGVSVLSRANQLPQIALSLLQG